MNEKQQILYMKIRLVELASQKWQKKIGEVAEQFYELKIFEYISDNYNLFHIQGDQAILQDITNYIQNKKLENKNAK